MNQPHDPNRTVDTPSPPADPLGTTAHARGAASTGGQRPAPDEPEGGLPAVPGYRVLREIARGGMGRVLAAYDLGLDRDVALKILLPGADASRFVRESKITARLPHPNIPPVHALGSLADGSPFLAMKLIAGRTLADEMKAADRPRLLEAFTQVCQAAGFAHSLGFIHRDLKPTNVMVGAFGEVQVMDWGLAKDLASPEPSGMPRSAEGLVTTGAGEPGTTRRGGAAPDATEAGFVMGTPAYMAPEQARGEPADARADVFALGGILCAILTGQPPFQGKSSLEVIKRAGAADLSEANARLDGCGADAELVALCRRCLSPAPAGQADGRAVADELTAYLNGVQERLQGAERERAVAVVRASEERRRRKVQFVLAASVLALTLLGGLSAAYYLQQRQARAAASERALGQATTLFEQAKTRPEDPAGWQVALAAAGQAEAGEPASAHPRLPALRTQIEAGLEAARRGRALLARLVEIRSDKADDWDLSATEAAYAEVFREAGIDVAGSPPAEAGAMVRARPPALAQALTAALDDWAAIRRHYRTDRAGAVRLRDAARAADPDPWRHGLRNALDLTEHSAALVALQTLARSENLSELDATSLVLLGNGLVNTGDVAGAEAVLRQAQRRHPRDVWVNYTLGTVLESLSRRDEAIRFFTAARSLRPETGYDLAQALAARGDRDEALAVFRDLVARRPDSSRSLFGLGMALKARGLSREAGERIEAAAAAARAATRARPGDTLAHTHLGTALLELRRYQDAIAVFRTAVRLRPDSAKARGNLGNALMDGGRLDEAAAAHREAVRLKPASAAGYNLLGVALARQGKEEECVAAYRESVRLKPDHFMAHYNLGHALKRQGKIDEAGAAYREALRLKPDLADALVGIGDVVRLQGKLDEAMASYRKAISLNPGLATAHGSLGIGLKLQGKVDEAAAAYRQAIRLDPDLAEAQANLGNILAERGKRDEAIAAYREAIRARPDLAEARGGLAKALMEQGKHDEAIREFREAIRLRPDSVQAHNNLGAVLLLRGKSVEAVAALREAVRLGPDVAEPRSGLGNALRAQGKVAEAAHEYREAIRLKPDYAEAHYNLGTLLAGQGKRGEAAAAFRETIRLKPGLAPAHNSIGVVLLELGKPEEAAAAFREAIRLKPDDPAPHNNLGNAHMATGKPDEAITEYREALRRKPDDALAHYNLGKVLADRGKTDEAIVEYRTTIRLDPGHAEAHCNLAGILKRRGDHAGALGMAQKGHELGSRRPDWRYPSAQWVAQARRDLALSKRLPAVLRGEGKPADDAERLGFAAVAFDGKKFAAAARLSAEAFVGSPKLGDDLQAGHRYNAACAAALAAAGRGVDEPALDGAAMAKLRGQALGWLKADLAARAKQSQSFWPGEAAKARAALAHWQRDGDLAGLRDAAALAKLPAEEQKAFTEMWADVAALLTKAGGSRNSHGAGGDGPAGDHPPAGRYPDEK